MLISTKEELKEIIENAKESGKTVLIKKGVFDIIHPGHIYAIHSFRKYADIIIILVQSDELTTKKKGKYRPINNQQQRSEVVDAIKGVDYTFQDKSSSSEEYIKFLNYLKPNIVAITAEDKNKTKEYSNPIWELKEFPDKLQEGFSTTEIINKILEKYIH